MSHKSRLWGFLNIKVTQYSKTEVIHQDKSHGRAVKTRVSLGFISSYILPRLSQSRIYKPQPSRETEMDMAHAN